MVYLRPRPRPRPIATALALVVLAVGLSRPTAEAETADEAASQLAANQRELDAIDRSLSKDLAAIDAETERAARTFAKEVTAVEANLERQLAELTSDTDQRRAETDRTTNVQIAAADTRATAAATEIAEAERTLLDLDARAQSESETMGRANTSLAEVESEIRQLDEDIIVADKRLSAAAVVAYVGVGSEPSPFQPEGLNDPAWTRLLTESVVSSIRQEAAALAQGRAWAGTQETILKRAIADATSKLSEISQERTSQEDLLRLASARRDLAEAEQETSELARVSSMATLQAELDAKSEELRAATKTEIDAATARQRIAERTQAAELDRRRADMRARSEQRRAELTDLVEADKAALIVAKGREAAEAAQRAEEDRIATEKARQAVVLRQAETAKRRAAEAAARRAAEITAQAALESSIAETASGGTVLVPLSGLDFSQTLLNAFKAAAAGQSGCSLRWEVLAAISRIESRHGTMHGAQVLDSGYTTVPILGIELTGLDGTLLILDTDSGQLDGDVTYDRAVGPMQFIPTSWALYGVDGNGDGERSPHNYFDATAAAARLLCRYGPLGTEEQLRQAVLHYNRSTTYNDMVIDWMTTYRGVNAT